MKNRGRNPAGADAYDEVPYPSAAHRPAHPSRLGALARLHGLEPADPASCTFLDLGCGDAVNPLSIAASLPDARCSGLDASAAAIERGIALRDAAGLGHVELRVADLRAPDATDGLSPADYIDVHGVLSWVDADVREAAISLAARSLTPNGVLVASYNALPGWGLLQGARQLALRRIEDLPPDADQRKAAALEAVRLAIELHGKDDAHGRALSLAAERYERFEAGVLYHDDLAPICEPLSLGEVVQIAERHGLRYLGEGQPDQWWTWRLAPSAVRRLRAAARDGAVAAQIEADAASGALFKSSIFVRADVESAAETSPGAALELWASLRTDSQDHEPPTSPAVARVLKSLEAEAPAAVAVRELLDEAGVGEEAGGGALLRLVAELRADLWLSPPRFAVEAGPRPEASPLARAQLASSPKVANFRHEPITFAEPLGRALLAVLDGTRDRPAIAREVAARAFAEGVEDATEDRVAAVLDEHLDILARQALLVSA